MNKFENSKKTHFNPLCLDKTEFNNLTNSLKNVEFYFTDLRDGNQSAYYSPSIQSQIEVWILIEKYINAVEWVLEWWYAGATVSEKEKFEALRDKIVLGAFCSSKIKWKDIKEHFSSTLEAKTPVVTIFVKSRLSDVLNTLKITPKENLQNIEENISYLKNSQKQVYVDMEHFFDWYLLNSAYAIETIKSALDWWADKIVLADTLGRTHPRQVRKIILGIFNDKDLSKKLQW
jgi:2-isopropylmalate synthase